jgi:hypothetical protein
MNSCQRCRALLGEYLDRTLAAPDRDEVAAHLETCADCRSELDELELTKTALSVLSPVAAPDDLRRRVRVALHNETQKKPAAGFLAGLASWRPQQLVWTGTLTFSALALLLLVRPATLNSPSAVSTDIITENGSSDPPAPITKAAPAIKTKSTKSSPKQIKSREEVTNRTPDLSAPVVVPAPKVQSERASQPKSAPERPVEIPSSRPAPNRVQIAPAAKPSPPVPLSAGSPSAKAPPRAGNPHQDGLMRQRISPPATEGQFGAVAQDSTPSGRARKRSVPSPMAALEAPRIASARFSFEITEVPPGSADRETTMETRMAPAPEVADSAKAATQSAPSTFAAPVAPPARKNLTEDRVVTQEFGPVGPGPGTTDLNGDGAERKAAGSTAPKARSLAPSITARSLTPTLPVISPVQPRVFQLAVGAPRDVKNAQLRVELPATLRFEKEAADASRVVWSGDLAAGQQTQISLELLGARGGEKISLILEQKAGDGESKPIETQKLTLPVTQK